MWKRLSGVLAGTALLGSLALAHEHDVVGSQPKSSQSSSSISATGQGTGGSGTAGTGSASGTATGAPAGQGQVSGQIRHDQDLSAGSQLSGTVVQAGNKLLYVQHMGAVIPIRVDKDTKLGLSGKKLTDLKAGDEVQVSFMVKNRTDNMATSIVMGPATGGSGFQGLGATEESRNLGIGGSGSAGTGATGEDANVGKDFPVGNVPLGQDIPHKPMDRRSPDVNPPEDTGVQKPIY